MQAMSRYASDALLDLLMPFWQVTIAVCLLAVSIVAGHRLLMRGPSRMSHAIALTGGAVLGVIVVGVLLTFVG
jgi:hypothetical protein